MRAPAQDIIASLHRQRYHNLLLFTLRCAGCQHAFWGFLLEPDEMPHTLDATDWKIIKELQSDGNLTNVALASRVGLSPPPCLRRVRALEQAGLITGYTALVDEPALGFEVTGFALVGLHSQAEADLHAFENLVLSWPLVREAYMLSGESDYILKCVAQDLPTFQEFILNELTSAKNVASVKTNLTIRRAKQTPGVPV